MVDKIWYNMEELIGGSEERVLIETYWNVNEDVTNFLKRLRSINRNILECKWIRSNRNRVVIHVLIETYWNVNGIGKEYYDAHAKGINRNILECKYRNRQVAFRRMMY